MSDVAIVGVGMYPFGRHKDVSALETGAAARAALADAGMRITEDGIEVHTFGFAPSSPAGS